MSACIRPLRVVLLGRLRCSTSEGEAAFPARPGTRSLFAALAFANRGLERDWLAAALWPDVPDAAAGANLRRHLSYVAKWLRELTRSSEPIARAGSLVTLDASVLASVDVRSFSDAFARGDLEAAARAYGGELLEDLDDAWIAPERQRLRAMHVDVLSHLVEAARARNDFETALRYAETAHATDPFAEDWLRTTMRVRYAAGDRAGALNAFERHRALLARELDVEPMPETVMLAESMRRVDVPPDGGGSRSQARASETTAFIGRTAERAEISSALSQARLVTITGAPGIGKTRLGLRAAREFAEAGTVDLLVVDAGSASDAEHLESATIRAVTGRADSAHEGVLEDAVAGSQAIVIFDGCERLRETCAKLATRMLAVSGMRIVATSRIPLGLDLEAVVRLGPLAPPDAAELFRSRVRLSRPERREAEGLGELVERICSELDGLPLAIELAAARARVSTLAQVEHEVRSYAERPGRDLLHAAYESSYALLSKIERAVLRHFAAFANGWSEPVALAACSEVADLKTLRETASTLVAHSLVVPPGLHDVAARYVMLDATRDFALHRARELGQGELVARAQATAIARHYVTIGTRLRAEHAADHYREVERDLENINTALDTLFGGNASDRALAVELCLAVSRFWADCGYAREGERRLRLSLEALPANERGKRLELLRVAGTLGRDLGDYAGSYRDFTELVRLYDADEASAVERAKAQTMAANAARMIGDFDEAIALTRSARAAFVEHGEPYFAAWAVYATGTILLSAGRSTEAAIDLERATDLFNEAGATADSSSSIANLALCAYYEGRYEMAAELTREAVRRASEAGNRYYYAHALLNQAAIAHALGAAGEAWTQLLEAVRIVLELESLDLSISCAESAATLLADSRPEDASALLASADRARAFAHAPRFPVDLPLDERLRSKLVATLGTARFEACLARGRVTQLREALARLA